MNNPLMPEPSPEALAWMLARASTREVSNAIRTAAGVLRGEAGKQLRDDPAAPALERVHVAGARDGVRGVSDWLEEWADNIEHADDPPNETRGKP